MIYIFVSFTLSYLSLKVEKRLKPNQVILLNMIFIGFILLALSEQMIGAVQMLAISLAFFVPKILLSFFVVFSKKTNTKIELINSLFYIATVFALYFVQSDTLKIWYFNNKCNQATENVFTTSTQNKISISIDWHTTKYKMGQRGIFLGEGYAPRAIIKSLLSKKDSTFEIQAITKRKSCYITSLEKEFDFKCPNDKWEQGAIVAPIQIKYKYGAKNLLDVLPFEFSIVRTENNETLAIQKSYILLTGNMSEDNTRWYGWASSQGGKLCSNLTKPEQFIRTVLKQH